MTLQYKRIAGVEEKLQGHQFGLDIAFADDLLVNESEMSLWVPFASGVRRDGVGDLLEIGGIDTSRHIKNPVVLFDHGKAVQLPVGMSEDPDTKQYRVVLDPVAKIAKGKAYFYQGSKDMEGVGAGQVYEHALFCEQLFDLVVKRFIRAGSIGYQVKTARRLPADFNTGTPEGLHLISVLMLEFSVVVMPANADTVGKVLSLDKICGKSLSPYLVKSLAPYAPPRKAMMGYEGKARTPKQYPGDPPTLPGEGYNDSRNIGVGASTPNPNSVAGAETMVNLQQHTNQINAAERNRRMAEIQRQHHGLDVEEAEEKNLPRQGRKARTPNKYEGDSRPDVYGEGYNDSRNFTPTANPNSVAGAFRSNSHLPDDEYLEAHARIVRQHRGEETPEELDKAAEHNEWLSQQHLYPHPLRDIPGDERVRRAQKKRLPKQGQKANKKPTYRDVGAVPRTEFMGLADEQADLDQPFNTPHGLYSRSNYLPSYDPNTLAGHFAHTQEDGHDHMISRSEANDLATGRRQDTDIGEQGEYVPRPHPRDRKRKSIDKLSGGLADDKQPQDFDPAQLKAGIRVEMEHTDDSRLAREIAMDHLLEDPAYYQKLSRMEGKSVKAWSDELSNFSQGPDYEKHRDDILNTPLHLRNTSQHGVGDGPDAVRPRMTGQDRERQRLASLVMDEITNHDLGIDVEQAHLRERQEAQRNKQLPRQDRKANRDPAFRSDFDDTELVQQMDQREPGTAYNAEMVRSENFNYVHGPRIERNRQRAIERADAANARELEKEGKANLDPRQRQFVDQLNQYTGQELPDEEYHEVPPQNVNLTPRQQIFMDNLERMRTGTPRRSVKALRKLYGNIKSQPSDDIPKEKARQILKDGEVQGHPLTEKQRRMFGAAAGKSSETPVRNPAPITENSQRGRLDNLAYRLNEYARNEGQPELYQPVASEVHTSLKVPHYPSKAVDNDHNTPKTDLQRRIMASGSPLVEEGRVDPREHRRMMINPSIRKPVSGVTNERQVSIGDTGMGIGGVSWVTLHAAEHLFKSKSLRIKSLRKMYGTKMAKRKGESNEEYAARMNREEIENAERQYDQRINDYYHAAVTQLPHEHHPEITQHFDGEVRRGTRDMARAGDAAERNYERRLQGGKAYQEYVYDDDSERLIQDGMDPAINDPKTTTGSQSKRDRERYGPHTNYEYRPEREPGTANMPDYEGQEFGARNQFAFENQPSREEQENEYQARRERYYEENKALPGERLPVPHGAEIHRNTIPPAHRDFRVISSKSAEGEDDLPDFYKPKEPVHPPAPEQPRRYYMAPPAGDDGRPRVRRIHKTTADDINANLEDQGSPNLYREVPASSLNLGIEPEIMIDTDEDAFERIREGNEASGHFPKRRTPKTKGMKVRNWDEYEQHQERLDNESLQAQRDPNVTDEQNAAIQDRVGREYERLQGYSDKINQRQRRIDQRRQQEEKGLDLFSGATHNKIGKYTDRAFHSFETGQISEEELRKRLAQAARVRAEMDKARGQFMREKDDRLDQYNRQAVAGKSVEPEDDLPDFYKPKEGTPLPEPTPQQAHLQAYRDIENARRAINREQKEDTVDADWGRRASQRLTRRNITRSALNARTAGNISGAYEHLNRLPSKEDTLLPPEKSLKGRIKALREMYGKAASGKRPTRQQVGLGGDPEELAPTSPSIVIGQTPIDNPNPNSMAGALRIGQNEASREIEEGRHGLDPQAFEDRRKRESKISRMLRGTYDPEDDEDIEEGARIQEEMRGQHTRPHPLVDRPVKDGKSMGSDQEEVANKPLKDGVLPGLKRNKRSVNGDALLYVEEKDIPDVRKKADELGLKIHRITGNTPGYVRMRFQGNDDDIDTVARVFGRLADTKE